MNKLSELNKDKSGVIANVNGDALNCHEGIWATVDLEKNITLVRAKTPQERKHLSEIISDEGYTLIDFSHN